MSATTTGDPAQPTSTPEDMRFCEWITPMGEDGPARAGRRRGHHRLQIAVDTVAYANNIPLRLLLPDRLINLPKVVEALVEEPTIKSVLAQDAPELPAQHWGSLFDPVRLVRARDWILELPELQSPAPAELPAHWLQGMLALMPFIERKVWLTEMGNPLPVHSLCRMQDHWSLFVMMWTWKKSEALARSDSLLSDALGMRGMEVRTLRAFDLQVPEGNRQLCMPLVGPYFLAGDAILSLRQHEEYCDRFARFVEHVVGVDLDREGRVHTVPLRDDLLDALSTRIGLTPDEAELRSKTSQHTLDILRGARIPDVALANGMTRGDWEVIAGLVAWLARWDDALIPRLVPGTPMSISHAGDMPSLLVELRVPGSYRPERRLVPRVQVSITDRIHAETGSIRAPDLLKMVEAAPAQAAAEGVPQAAMGERDAFRVDRPERYFARFRERQNSMWSSQVIAINNLLSRHGPNKVIIGPDRLPEPGGRSEVNRDEADHLLRGFGGRICRYLVSMTRADAAAIYWLDYAQVPPRLLPAGDYSRHAAHRAKCHAIWEQFDQWAWTPGEQSECPANDRTRSHSQVYRVVATGVEDPPPVDLYEGSNLGDQNAPRRRKRVNAARSDDVGGSSGNDEVLAYFDNYPEPRPQDAIAAPLLVHGRVIGVVTLHGLVPGQFEPRLFWPLRRAASLAAASMNHESQVWHMRRLNYLFARHGLNEFARRGGRSSENNPLRDVSRCLSNIFLCPSVHIWLQSASNSDRLELLGYNWDELFRFADKPPKYAREFDHATHTPPLGPDGGTNFRPFSCMALDIARKVGKPDELLGRFVQGFFSKDEPQTLGYDTETASSRGTLLGRDFCSSGYTSDEDAALYTRQRIFGSPQVGGHEMLDIMSFALVTPENGGLKSEGVVTLHDKGDALREPLRRRQPWDRGWATVVAHVQTYLPYLFRQAEVLNNPDVDARRYLIHAGRAELIAVYDNVRRMRSLLESTLSPDRGVRQAIDRMLSPQYRGEYRDDLRIAQATVVNAWDSLILAASPNWERNLRQLANVMHDFRDLSRLSNVKLTARDEVINLKELLEETLERFKDQFRHRAPKKVNVPNGLELQLPGQWLRIVLHDLVHNAAKYISDQGSFDVTWDQTTRCLSMANESSYQSDLDLVGKLLSPRGQGSAGLAAHDEAPTRISDGRGHGLGLWGAKLLCGVMSIDFSIHIRPQSQSLQTLESGAQRGKARYIVKLAFPADAIASFRPAGKGFY